MQSSEKIEYLIRYYQVNERIITISSAIHLPLSVKKADLPDLQNTLCILATLIKNCDVLINKKARRLSSPDEA